MFHGRESVQRALTCAQESTPTAAPQIDSVVGLDMMFMLRYPPGVGIQFCPCPHSTHWFLASASHWQLLLLQQAQSVRLLSQ